MSTVYDLIYSSLNTSGYPVKEHGTFGNEERLPDTFMTYQLLDDEDASHADNKATRVKTIIQVTLYTKSPELYHGSRTLIHDLLSPSGFLRSGGRPLPFQAKSEHYAYASTYHHYQEV